MKDLETIRNEIDKIDDVISKEYVKRMKLCKEVADVKKESNKTVLDGERENKILYRITDGVEEEYKLYLKNVYETIFQTSKAYQNAIIDEKSDTVSMILKAEKEGIKDMPIRGSLACQGVNGAYSGIAGEKLFPISDITYFKTFDGVFSAVSGGLCEYGILPIENSTAGSVLEVYDLMKKHSFHIVGSVRIKVSHCLAGIKGATKKDIVKVVSHPQALSQCKEYIEKNKYKQEEAENTAVSAKRVAENNDKTVAVICSPKCAKLYGLTIIEDCINDNANNYTRFICITKDFKIYKGSDKISIMANLPHKSGSLNNLLTRFSVLGLNLTKIESRPKVGSDFEFTFYFDFNGDIFEKKVQNLITELENSLEGFTLLGCYKETL